MEIYKCIKGQLPEDIIPEKFLELKNGQLVSPYLVISNNDKNDLATPFSYSTHSLVRRVQTKNKQRYTWCGHHPLYWREYNKLYDKKEPDIL